MLASTKRGLVLWYGVVPCWYGVKNSVRFGRVNQCAFYKASYSPIYPPSLLHPLCAIMRRGKPCIQRQNAKWYRGEQNPILYYHVAQHNGGSSTISRSLNANNFGSIVNGVSTIRHAVLTWRYTRLAPFDGENTPCSPRVAFLPTPDCCSQVAEASWRVAITHASFLMALNRMCGQVSLMRRRAQTRDT